MFVSYRAPPNSTIFGQKTIQHAGASATCSDRSKILPSGYFSRCRCWKTTIKIREVNHHTSSCLIYVYHRTRWAFCFHSKLCSMGLQWVSIPNSGWGTPSDVWTPTKKALKVLTGCGIVWKRGTQTSTGLPGLLDHDYGNNKLSSCSLTIVLQFWSLPVSGESDTFQTASSCERLQLPWAFGNAGSCRETSCASITSMDRWSSPKWVGGLKRFCSFNHTVDGRNPINHQ